MSADESTKKSRIDVLVQEDRFSGRPWVLKTSPEDASLHSSATTTLQSGGSDSQMENGHAKSSPIPLSVPPTTSTTPEPYKRTGSAVSRSYKALQSFRASFLSSFKSNQIADSDSEHMSIATKQEKVKPAKSSLRSILKKNDHLHSHRRSIELSSELQLEEERSKADKLLRPRKNVRIHVPRNINVIRLPSVQDENSAFIHRWSSLFMLPLAYETWAFPFRFALCQPGSSLLFVTDLICDIFFVMDFIIHAFVEVPGRKGSSRWWLFRNYFRQRFHKELFPSIIFFLLSSSYIPIWLWWLSTIPRLVPRLQRLRSYFNKMELNLEMDVDKLQIFKFTLVIFLSCHWVGCTYYWLARLLNFADNTWIGQFEETMPNIFNRYESPVRERYLALLYRGWIGLAPNSYRKPAQNWPEQLFSVAVMFMAMLLSAYLLGSVLPYIVKNDPAAEAFQARRINFLRFANNRDLPSGLISKVMNYYEFQHSKVKISNVSSIKLTRSLKLKVANRKFRPYIDRHCVRGQCFFRCEPQFLNSIVSSLKEIYLMPGEDVIRKGDIARELYFVADGVVQVIENGEVKREIRGDVQDMPCVLGEVSMFLGIPHYHGARSSSDTDVRLLVLTQDVIEKLLNQYPEEHEKLLRNILANFNLDLRGKTLDGTMQEEDNDMGRMQQKHEIQVAIKRRENEMFSALSYATVMGDVEEVRRLIRRGADINSCNYDKRTMLHVACSEGNTRIVEVLLESGAEKNIKSRWGQTPLVEAIYAKQPHIVQELLRAQCKLMLDDPAAAMCDYASRGDVENLRILLSNRVDPNLGDYDRRTPLHLAAAEGNDRVVELLLSFSAEINIKDRWEGTPLKDAVVNGKTVVAELLRSRGAVMPAGIGAQEMCNAASQGDVGRMRMLHACGISPDEGDYDSRAPLHLAASSAKLLAISFLLGLGAEVNIKDRWGSTPMDDCARGDTTYHVVCAKMLQGWGGKLSVMAGTAEGRRLRERMEDLDMNDVSCLMRRLISAGLMHNRPKTLNEQELRTCFETCVQLFPLFDKVKAGLEPYCDALEYSFQLQVDLHDELTDFLFAVGKLSDLAAETGSSLTSLGRGGSRRRRSFLNSMRFKSTLGQMKAGSDLGSTGSNTPLVQPIVGERRSDTQKITDFLDNLSEDSLNPDMLLYNEMDEESLKLYEEIDEIVLRNEKMYESGNQGKERIAKTFNKYLMQLSEVESMYQCLNKAVASLGVRQTGQQEESSLSAAIDVTNFSIALDQMGFRHVKKEQREAIFEEAIYTFKVSDGVLHIGQILAGSQTFRDLLFDLEGSSIKLEASQFSQLQSSEVLRCLPLCWKVEVVKEMKTRLFRDKSKLFVEGQVPERIMLIKRGSVRLEKEKEKISTMPTGKLQQLGEYELFTGSPMLYSVYCVGEVEAYTISFDMLIDEIKDSPGYAINIARSLLSSAQKQAAQGTDVMAVEWYLSKEGQKADDLQEEIAELVWERFGVSVVDEVGWNPDESVWRNEKSFLVDTESFHKDQIEAEIDACQEILPGLQVIRDSWNLFSFGMQRVAMSEILSMRSYLGEVGGLFFQQFEHALEKSMKTRAEEKQERKEDAQEYVSMADWWYCWMLLLEGNAEQESKLESLQMMEKLGDVDIASISSYEFSSFSEPNIFDFLLSFVTRRRIRNQLLSEQAIDRYEAAFLMTVGNMTDALVAGKVPLLIRMVLPHLRTVSNVNVVEFFRAFADGEEASRSIKWITMKKVVRERKRELATAHEDEPVLMEDTTVFNPSSRMMQAWFVLIRAVAMYIFVSVPVRLTYLPFRSIGQWQLLASDLVADLLIILHVLITFNSAYQNKKSRWVTDRSKIAKHYLSSNFLDLIASFPFDYFAVLLGLNFFTSQWLRLFKMLCARWIWHKFPGSISVPRGLLKLAILAFMALHISATIWSALGLSEQEGWTLGETWYFAASAQTFLEGMADGRKSISMWELYTLSLNWIATHTVSAIGNSTIYPKNYVEIIFAIIQLTIGMTFYRMVLGKISSVVMKKDEQIIKDRTALASLESFIVSNRLDQDAHLADEIRTHFHVSRSSKAVDMSDIVDNLNYSLQFELASLLCREFLDHAAIFKGCSEAFLDSLSVSLREVVFGPEETIFQIGDMAEDMFLLTSGTVDKIETTLTGNDVVVGSLKKGSAVGEVSFAFGMKRLYTARANMLTGAVCLRLSRTSYLQVLKLCPEDQEIVTSNSLFSFEKARSEHSTSHASSKRSASRAGSQFSMSLAQEEEDEHREEEEEERTIASDSLAESNDEALESIIGAGVFSQIQSLRTRQAKTQMLLMLEACQDNDLQKLKKLISRGSSVNDCDENKRTPLHIAASEGNLEIVKYLVASNADANSKDAFHNTPLNDAVQHEHDNVASFLRENTPVKTFVLPGAMAAVKLLTYAYEGNLEGTKRLISNGVSVNAEDYDRRTSLHLASCEGHLHIVQFLLESKADPSSKDRFGGTALQDAIRHGKMSVQTCLKEHGSRVVGIDTAIMMCEAAGRGDLSTIQTLLSNGVNPNLPDYDGRTALHLAASNNAIQVLDFLLHFEPKVDPNPIDITGGTPLDDAIRHGNEVAAKMLELAGGLTKDDERLAELILYQKAENERQMKAIRDPQVLFDKAQSRESKFWQAFEEFVTVMSSPMKKLEDADAAQDGNQEDEEEALAVSGDGDRMKQKFAVFEKSIAELVQSMKKVVKVVNECLGKSNETAQQAFNASFKKDLLAIENVTSTPEKKEGRNARRRQSVVVDNRFGIDPKIQGLRPVNILNFSGSRDISVTILCGRHLPKMDAMGGCDTYCVLEFGNNKFQTSVIKNSYSPDWNETFQISIPEITQCVSLFKLHIYDWNRFSSPDYIGEASLPPDIMSRILRAESKWKGKGQLKVTNGIPIVGNDGQETEIFIEIGVGALTEEQEKQHTSDMYTSQDRSDEAIMLDSFKQFVEKLNVLHRCITEMYRSIPEFPDTSPKLYKMAASRFMMSRERFLASILRTAAVLQFAKTFLQKKIDLG